MTTPSVRAGAAALARAAERPGQIVAVFDRHLEPANGAGWLARFAIALEDRVAPLRVRVPADALANYPAEMREDPHHPGWRREIERQLSDGCAERVWERLRSQHPAPLALAPGGDAS